MILPKKKFKDSFTVEAEQILNSMLEEIETNAMKTKQFNDQFNSGWQSAFRHMFWFCVDRGIKPVTYNGQLIFEHIHKPTEEQINKIKEAIDKAKKEGII